MANRQGQISRDGALAKTLMALRKATPVTTVAFARAMSAQRDTTAGFSFESLEQELRRARLRNPFAATTLNEMQVIVPKSQAARVKAVDRVLNDRRRYSVQSLTSVTRAASWRMGAEALRVLLDAVGGITWLDEPRQWLWITGSDFERCRVQREMAKIACEAEWLDAEVCATALLRLFRRQPIAPSVDVLARAIRHWDWLQTREGRVRPMLGIDSRLVFRPPEQAIYSVLRSEPSWIPRAELVVRCELRGIRPHTTYRVVRKAPWVTVDVRGVRLTRLEAART